MDFKIKIDLFDKDLAESTPTKQLSGKKRRHPDSESGKKRTVLKSNDKVDDKESSNKKKKIYRRNLSSNKKVGEEKPKINSNSIISLTLPNNDNIKNDQAQKLSMLAKKKPRHWEKRWVLMPNVFEFTKEIWVKKWVLVDGGEDIVDNNVKLKF